MIILQSPYLQFTCMPEHATWSLVRLPEATGWIDQARMSVAYRCPKPCVSLLDTWEPLTVAGPETVPSPHGPLQQLRLSAGPDAQGVRYEMRFALAEHTPLFLYQVSLVNEGSFPIYVERIGGMRAGVPDPDRGRISAIRLHADPGEIAFFSNGWQSWAYSGVYGPGEAMRHTRLGWIQEPLCVNPGTPQPRSPDHYASDFFGILGDRTHRTGLLAGFLSQQQHFGSLEARTGRSPSLCLWANGDGARLDVGEQLHTDWAVLSFLDLDDADPLAPYLEAVARHHAISVRPEIPTGWCSWYHFYQKVTAEDIRHNLRALQAVRPALPLDLVQIDDGFESQVGDWFSFDPSFPQGVAPLAQEIEAAGFTPGLWLAPFIVHPRSRLAREHPEFLLRGRLNQPANAGFIWNVFTHALDLSYPPALEYACRVVDTAAHAWGFPYLKLDFIYAGALAGRRHDPTRSRAQILRAALEALRSAAGEETYLLGCGAPLGSSLGIFDAMRVSADVSGEWRPAYFGNQALFRDEPFMPSARNALQNTLARAPMHQRWWTNDPDCLLVRPDTHLTLAETQALATAIALTGGSMLLSDDLPALPAERLRIVQALLPLIGERPRLLDWFDASTPSHLRLDLQGPAGPWRLLALFNWADQAQDLTFYWNDFDLPARPVYLARSFWGGETYRIEEGSLDLRGVPAHGAVLLAVRSFDPAQPLYLGSDLHISQGMEVAGWEVTATGVSLHLELPRRAEGLVDLSLPREPHSATLGERSIDWEVPGEGCYRFHVDFDRSAKLEVFY